MIPVEISGPTRDQISSEDISLSELLQSIGLSDGTELVDADVPAEITRR